MTVLTQVTPPTAFILSEANGQRSRENYLVSHGDKLKAGEVAQVEDAFSLTTNATTHTSTSLTGLVSVAGLVVGEIYVVAGTGIPAGTTFTYTGSSAGTLSAAATASATVSCAFTRPEGVSSWASLGNTIAGISLYAVDATDGAVMGSFIARDAEVNTKLLVFPANTDTDVIADLASVGIICRD